MIVTVSDVKWRPEQSRRAEVELIDSAGNTLRLVDFEGANISIRWKKDHQYRIVQCGVTKGGDGYDLDLTPSKKTEIKPLGPVHQSAEILFVGDTHIGRNEHPRTGEEIDPLGALISAVKHGLDHGVDAVVHAGDIFHETATARHSELVNQNVLVPLRNTEVPFYYVTGNHTSPTGQELLNEQSCKHVVNLDTSGTQVGEDVRVFGLDHFPEGEVVWSKVQFPGKINESVSILVLHQTLDQLSGSSSRSVDLRRIQQRAPEQFDVVVAGHHHDAIRSTWNESQVMYTGAAERMSTKDDPVDRVAWLLRRTEGTVSCERFDIP